MAMERKSFRIASECLAQDREGLLAFYDLPAESWVPMRTTKPIASTCATRCGRTARLRGGISHVTRLAMGFQLSQSAAKRWQRLRAVHDLPEVMHGITFKDGLRIAQDAA